MTEVYNPKAFVPHAALLGQAFAHCRRFPTAASRRSLDRVSVPVWPFTLSSRLTIRALVSRYLTNKLIVRKPISQRCQEHLSRQTDSGPASYPVLIDLSASYPRLRGRLPTRYSPVRHSVPPEASFRRPIVRLACMMHAASVSPEPGSNSPLWIFELAGHSIAEATVFPDLEVPIWTAGFTRR